MKKSLTVIILALAITSCNGEYKKQLELGAMVWCELKAIKEQIKETPDDYELIDQRERLLRRMDTHEELSGDPVKFREDIKALSKECK